MTGLQGTKRIGVMLATAASVSLAGAAVAQGNSPSGAGRAGQRSSYSYPGNTPFAPSSTLQLPKIPVTPPITANGTVVEDVIARVNDRIITRTEYVRSQQQLLQDAQQHSTSQAELTEAQNNLLRDMIDRQILLAKGKELDITGDADMMRQLDQIRIQNHLADLDALQHAAEQQGVSFEDFKQQLRDEAITRDVVRDEVGRHINMSTAQEQAYYAAHGSDFTVPEQVHLSEILVPTAENATEAQLAEAQAKADALESKLKGGASFADVARTGSGGPTASSGGDLGDFKRGVLGGVLEDATFSLPVGGVTAPIRTRQGFVILKVDSHQAAGVPPLKDVEPQVQEAIYMAGLQPALRAYLSKQRTDEYVNVDTKDGFVDTGAVQQPKGNGNIGYTAYAPPPVKKKTVKRQEAEQKRAAAAQAALTAEREKAQEKAAAKAAAQQAKQGGATNVSRPVKPPKVHREKIRYGQAPRNALPSAATETAQESAAPIQGQAPGVAMAPTESTTTMTAGVGPDAEVNPLAAQAPQAHKTRFSQRQPEQQDAAAVKKVEKTETKASLRPVAATQQQSADEKEQSGPLGLNGDTVKKTKPKREKGQPKQRLERKEQPAQPAPLSPTVNPAVVGSPAVSTNPATSPAPPKPSSNTTTLPPTDTGAPGAFPAGQPIPSATSATPGAAPTTPTPH